MHEAGTISHAFTHVHHDRRVELVINSPAITLRAATGPAGEIQAAATSRVMYHERLMSDPADLGQSAVCEVTVQASLQLAGDPAPIDATSLLEVDWDATTASDIVVYGAAPSLEASIRSALLDFVHDQ